MNAGIDKMTTFTYTTYVHPAASSTWCRRGLS